MSGPAWQLEGAGAVVVGGGRGIGEATAMALGRAGACVWVIDVDRDRAQAVQVAVQSVGGEASVGIGDIRDRTVARRLVEGARERLGRIDALVTVAGGMHAYAPWGRLADWSPDKWDEILGRNLGYVHGILSSALPIMVEQGGGSIVSIASLSGVVSSPRHAPYGAAKAGLISLIRSVAVEYGPFAIRANSVAPGGIASAAVADVSTRGLPVPLGRWGTPDDIANAVCFLSSPLSGYVTGQTLVVDGGAAVNYPVPLPGED